MTKPIEPLKQLTGQSIASGIAIGPAFVLSRDVLAVPKRSIAPEEVEAERARLNHAAANAIADLDHLSEKSHDLPKAAGEEVRVLIEAHKAMLEGRLLKGAEARINRQKCNAEAALDAEIKNIVASFEAIGDAYIAARAADVKAVGARLMRFMLVTDGRSLADAPKGSIIIAEDLSPADAALLDPNRVAGLITQGGGQTGHTAILARALNLPTIMGIANLLGEIRDGQKLVVDGREGLLVVEPDEATLQHYVDLQALIKEKKKDLKRLKNLVAVTKDGAKVMLNANLEIPLEVDTARQAGAEGIGLLRTEFMFMNRTTLPDEEQQYTMLRHVVEQMEGKPVTIRTLDVGGEKMAAVLENRFSHSPNPALGLRAIRLSLKEEHLLLTQFSAILRAAVHGNVKIMLPMITNVAEVERARQLLETAARRLKRRGEPVPETLPPVGVLIEVPAAALIADDMAKVSDFFAIGTNDLTQYTLAVDRGDEQVADLYDPLHPAVQFLLKRVVEAGKKANIPVSVCGEMGGDKRYTELLLRLGLRELSMAPVHIPRIKREIRDMTLTI